ncbi:MAG TPA: HAD family hydrolase [Candidatus Tumulicola sp.]|jgi:phosphoserine phosphatase
MNAARRGALLATLAAFALSIAVATAATDPLPSWNEGAAKTSIVRFVQNVTAPGAGYVAPERRVAVFDNDGTLWPEQPVPTELLFVVARIRALAPRHPAWTHEQPFAAAIRGDITTLEASGKSGLSALIGAAVTGMTTTQFDDAAKTWLATARNPKYHRLYARCTYQPMIEVLDYLRANGFTTYIVSGGTNDFVRAFAQTSYGIPPDRVIGTTLQTQYRESAAGPQLVRLPKLLFIDDGAGKPEAIQRAIGVRPIAAFGNSDGDRQMLEWTAAGTPALMVVVHHTDAAREYAYDRTSKLAKLDRLLDEATAKSWTVVDMRRDWSTVFPPNDL